MFQSKGFWRYKDVVIEFIMCTTVRRTTKDVGLRLTNSTTAVRWSIFQMGVAETGKKKGCVRFYSP